ncbi:MAG: hypothetical protein IKI21_06315, partial [Oscillospiraceae bacterium]|nr:hypothetical protein [Oscillospiraceae bacterium]
IPPERLMACFGAAMTCLPDSLSSDMLSMVISQRIEKLFSHPHAIWRALHEAYDKALDTRTAAAVIEGWRDAILSAADCLDDGAPPDGPVDEVADRMRAVTDQCGAGVNDAARYLAAHACAMREDAAFCRDVRVLSGVDDELYGDFRFSVILHGKEDHHGD